MRRVLLSVESNPASRAADEVAYSLAAHNDGMVFALHLITETADGPYFFDMKSSAENFMAGRALVEESVVYGQRLGARVHADVRPVAQPEGELTATANSENWDLLVVGAANRPLTSRPFFGYGMSYILKHVTIPLVIVAVPAAVYRSTTR